MLHADDRFARRPRTPAGLLEDLIYSVEGEGVDDAAILHAVPKGPLTSDA
jgi:hypothetical protein